MAANPNNWPPGIDPRLAALYTQYGATPTGRGTGFTDWQYWQNEALKNAGGDWNYILGRLGGDLAGTGPDTQPQGTQMMGGPVGGGPINTGPLIPPIQNLLGTPGGSNAWNQWIGTEPKTLMGSGGTNTWGDWLNTEPKTLMGNQTAPSLTQPTPQGQGVNLDLTAMVQRALAKAILGGQ